MYVESADMILKIIGIICLSIISAITYRMGGSGNYPRWTRGAGLAVCVCLSLLILGYHHWTILLCSGATYGLSTTYFKKSGTDANWFNWLFVGLGFSISILPIVLVYGLWIGFTVRTLVCTGLIILWSETNGNAVWEEGGRGTIPVITLPLLLIGS